MESYLVSKTILVQENEFTCISRGYNLRNVRFQGRKHYYLTEKNMLNTKFFPFEWTLKKVYETNDFNKLCEILSKLKNKS